MTDPIIVPDGVEVKLEVDVANGRFRYVELTPDELAQRAIDQAAEAALEASYVPPVNPVVSVVQQVLSAPDFDTAKKNLAAYIAGLSK